MKILLAALMCLFLIYPKTGAECPYRDPIFGDSIKVDGYVTMTPRHSPDWDMYLSNITIQLQDYNYDMLSSTSLDEDGYYCFGYYNPDELLNGALVVRGYSSTHSFNPVRVFKSGLSEDWRLDPIVATFNGGHHIIGKIQGTDDYTGITVELSGGIEPPLVSTIDIYGFTQ